MTQFGKWLGKSNGKEMLLNILLQNVTKEQARAAVTTYCILLDVDVDTSEWDELMRDIFEHYNSWFDDFETMDMFMCADLV